MPRMTITYKGERLLIKEAAERAGLSYATLHSRLSNGWSVKEAMELPAGTKFRPTGPQPKRHLFKGQMLTAREIAAALSLPVATINARITRKMPLATPIPFKRKPSGTRYDFAGKSLTLSEWSDFLGISKHTLRERLLCGWTVERALSTPLDLKQQGHTLKGKQRKQAGGYVQTSKGSSGTGVGSVPRDFHGDQS